MQVSPYHICISIFSAEENFSGPPANFLVELMLASLIVDPIFWVPILSVIAIYAVRLRELGTRRDTVPGYVHENLTLRLFLAVGTVLFIASLLEYIVVRHGRISWVLFIAGWLCA